MSYSLLQQELAELKNYTPQAQNRVPGISQWTIGQQLEHVFVVNLRIFSLVNSPQLFPASAQSLTKLGRLVLLTSWIPRGRGKAPEFSLPQSRSREELAKLIEEVEHLWLELQRDLPAILTDSKLVGEHPYFGSMTRKQWLRFAEIHQRHHLKIIKAIASAAGA